MSSAVLKCCSFAIKSLSRQLGVLTQQSAPSTVNTSASKRSIRRFVITQKAPTWAFSWLKVATTTFTFKTLLRHYTKRVLTPRSLKVKLGPGRNYYKGWAAIRHYANQTAHPLWPLRRGHYFTLRDSGVNAHLVGAFSVITNLRMELFEALVWAALSRYIPPFPGHIHTMSNWTEFCSRSTFSNSLIWPDVLINVTTASRTVATQLPGPRLCFTISNQPPVQIRILHFLPSLHWQCRGDSPFVHINKVTHLWGSL